ncbi:MAG: sialate O-acetylesterase [Phycisphaerae bacterium]|jgi:sialate O-acetylesterase|nr:sialate O-acetylesterase [Phycisphaerae bacterium]
MPNTLKHVLSHFLPILLVGVVAAQAVSAEKKKMPRENVIEVPAIGEGLCVHNLFQTNMVLQRDKAIGVWGWATPDEEVTVSFAGRKQTATAAKDRSWKVTFPAMKANSAPHELTVQGKNKTLKLENILIGDVWILGGQSNMEEPIQHVEDGKLEIASANFPNIRILTVPAQNGPKAKKGFPRLHEWSSWSSRHFRKGDWDICSPETVREVSAIGYVFARRIYMAVGVPIGLIDTSRGGTTVETWTPTAVLKKIDTKEVKAKLAEWDKKIAEWDPKKDLANRVKGFNNWVRDMKKRGEKIPEHRKAPTDHRPGPTMDQNRPGNCYSSMIVPVAGLAVKGAIFHQGFNNANGGSSGSEMYYQIFGKTIAAWRGAFGDPKMPFGIISLCTAGSPQTRDNYLERMLDDGIYIREAQYKTFMDFYKAGDKNIGFASSFDQRRSWYHPQKKVPVGERIASWALGSQYGMDDKVTWIPPMHKEMKVEGGQIVLTMDTWMKAIDDGPIVGFAIAGKDRRFQTADANWLVKGKDRHNRPQYDRRVVVLTSKYVPNPIHFRYAWGRNPMANFTRADHTAIPFATQRSDNWKQEEVPEKYVWDKSSPPREYSRRLKWQAQKDLRLDDMKRRLAEAKAFIDENKEKYEKDRKYWEQSKAKNRERFASESK